MNLEVSTINLLLGLIVGMQVWIIRQLFGIKTRLAVISALCPMCLKDHKREANEQDR